MVLGRAIPVYLSLFMALLAFPMEGMSHPVEMPAHPDHGASFLEQLTGQWVIEGEGEETGQRLRFYEDGRFAFQGEGAWTAGSFVILRSDERQKGVLRLEYYVDGNLHLQEVLCEVHFTAGDGHGEHGHDHADGQEHEGHEYLLVEVLPAAEQRLDMAGDYLHRH